MTYQGHQNRPVWLQSLHSVHSALTIWGSVWFYPGLTFRSIKDPKLTLHSATPCLLPWLSHQFVLWLQKWKEGSWISCPLTSLTLPKCFRSEGSRILRLLRFWVKSMSVWGDLPCSTDGHVLAERSAPSLQTPRQLGSSWEGRHWDSPCFSPSLPLSPWKNSWGSFCSTDPWAKCLYSLRKPRLLANSQKKYAFSLKTDVGNFILIAPFKIVAERPNWANDWARR